MTADPLVQLVNVTKRYAGAAALERRIFQLTRQNDGADRPEWLRKINAPPLDHRFDQLIVAKSISMERKLRADKIDIVRRRIGYVIQEGGLFPHLTAHRYFAHGASSWSCRKRMLPRLSELCALTRFPENLLNRYPLELSGASDSA